MNVLLISSRAPVTLDLIRVLGRAGHTVYATDTQPWTLGSHSRYLRRHFVTPAPRHDYEGFAAALERVIAEQEIDLLVPTCEEVFWIGRYYERLAAITNIFTAPLDQLRLFHNKATFGRMAAERGICTPRTAVVYDCDELLQQLPRFPRYLLKPAYGRFATRIITNCGPRANLTPLTACTPTPAAPWLLQEYVDGTAVCSYSLVQRGHVAAHCAYTTPITAGGGAGVQFRTVDGSTTLAVVRRLLEDSTYTGQLALDFLATPDGLVLLECNPRATSGAHLIDAPVLVGGLLDPQQRTTLTPAGRCKQITAAVLLSIARSPHRQRSQLHDLLLSGDVIMAVDDPLPALAQLPMLLHFWRISRRKRISLTAAMTDDIEWNGE
jgi:predicted ATP-grasp superfamily ATP-dependent carboligase